MPREIDGAGTRPDLETATPGAVRAVVAIPAFDEAERIEDCLRALARQDGLGSGRIGIVLFLNNCTDGTARVVADMRASLNVPLRVIERDFAGATAGWARREAMDAAAAWLEEAGCPGGVILTTDADTRVPANWVSRNLALIAGGVDAVAGTVALDARDAARLPDALHARGRMEGDYEALLAEIEAWIDPIPHDPWPRHRTTSGATLAVRVATYREVGGMPPLAVGEDRAFVSALLGSDARVRHDPSVVVVTSGRLDGRAPGGAADTMRLRCEMPDAPCDARLEALPRALLRYAWRRRVRSLRASGRLGQIWLWAPWLGIRAADARAVAQAGTTGLALAAVEAISPRLRYAALTPRSLPGQIGNARIVLALLRVGTRVLRRPRASRRVAVARAAGEPAART